LPKYFDVLVSRRKADRFSGITMGVKMIVRHTAFRTTDGANIHGYRWAPDPGISLKGAVQICHGMAEHAFRYERFAQRLCESGYVVYAHDQRGHGQTAGSLKSVGIIADRDGLDVLVDDLLLMTRNAHAEYPDLPVFLFAHSMGSFVAQRFIQLHGDTLAGVVLSGTNGKQLFLPIAGEVFARGEIRKNGRDTPSAKLTAMSFGGFNSPFRPNRTDFDWLSRDEAEVDKYIDDPYCGGTFPSGYFFDMARFLQKIQKPKNVGSVPVSLPVFLVSGEKDPVGGCGKGVLRLKNTYRKHGVKDLSCKLYPDARHEILNEINRDEVMNDVVSWIDARAVSPVTA
jgi:alpha-beta hydrolase superfamily lysophospholipase